MSDSAYSLRFVSTFCILLVVSLLIMLGIGVGYHTSPLEVIPGLLLFSFLSLGGLLLADIVPIPFPAVGWVAVLGVIFSVPGLLPWTNSFIDYANRIPFLATATPPLAFAGIAVGKDWSKFKKVGWKGIFVVFLVFSGTFVGSALVAEFLLRLTKAI
jgi:hypothetical protein